MATQANVQVQAPRYRHRFGLTNGSTVHWMCTKAEAKRILGMNGVKYSENLELPSMPTYTCMGNGVLVQTEGKEC